MADTKNTNAREQDLAASAASQTIVVKLGTSVLTGGTLKLDRAHMVELVRQCAMLRRQGHKVIIVTSGAIAAGREHLGYPELPKTMASKQLLAAVGQGRLIQEWETLFGIYGINIGQMLLTRADLNDRERYLNARDMIVALLDNGIVPVVNENDAVATTEIKVGDNDNLSALVGILGGADKLLLMTDQPGLFTADPRSNPDAELIREVHTIDETLRKLAGGSVGGLGTGGMATKLQAADVARRAGIEVIIAAGRRPDVIIELAEGKSVGTRFLPLESPLESRKRWILAGPPPAGDIVIDDGAVTAVQQRGSSLLAKGITMVKGDFERGEVVRIFDKDNNLLARGICRYSSVDMAKIAGKHSQEIHQVLGYEYGHVAIHRDDMVVI
ncbi:glutamate 5-kinase [Photobacterium leiognathi]|uniref:Glutamate 5-kinase n=3 Tax=Photobacterium leiognathi TaxID=553611 RepID=A0A0U1P742_PHOLE|nr:glutamate 5-kinase [Photobacterium leiognathi]KJF89812.1 gamma-glutamyl kinase [Photobacterium leiognathi]KJF97506.1 gamma-glutamyl kinase [Photobacterium leiognathi]MCG3885665.1 glutamate 5-kinase [Photobacterium leiognathi]PSV03716.1 glutamate 5-kinase [Photobacterium leiognathi subsp. mandapamensis]PSV13927.1 glutamate 5-kinase [Photobacterium leiognathi subsp. mandapamensis]